MKRMIQTICLFCMLFVLGGCGNSEQEHNVQEQTTYTNDSKLFEGYKKIEHDACDLDGSRKKNVVVDIGFGDRQYWAFTNEYGQLVKVIADEIILQDEYNEDVTSSGRYCKDEAKVPGTQSSEYDEGHIIADSLGGVSNAYNITPQNSVLNRHGDQAYMEKVIRQAGGCTDFTAIITYPDTKTQIPSHYSFTYTLKGNVIHDEFDNVNPETTIPGYNGKSEYYAWVSDHGTKYHSKPNCSTIMKSNVNKMKVEQAKEQGYQPCKRCH